MVVNKAVLNRLFSQACYLQRTEYLRVKNDIFCCFKNAEVDLRRIEAETLVQEGAPTLPNKNKPVHTSTIFKVQEREIFEGSEDTVDLSGVSQTIKGDFVSSLLSPILLLNKDICCLVLPGHMDWDTKNLAR